MTLGVKIFFCVLPQFRFQDVKDTATPLSLSLSLAYNPLIKDANGATETEEWQFSNIVSRAAGRAESPADEICAWAKTLVPDSVKAPATIRVKLDAHLVESSMTDDDDRDELQHGGGVYRSRSS